MKKSKKTVDNICTFKYNNNVRSTYIILASQGIIGAPLLLTTSEVIVSACEKITCAHIHKACEKIRKFHMLKNPNISQVDICEFVHNGCENFHKSICIPVGIYISL